MQTARNQKGLFASERLPAGKESLDKKGLSIVGVCTLLFFSEED